jgi:glycerate dehydrogenase
MKIVVLDGYALNPGDLSWERLQHLGEFTVYERTPIDLILKRSSGAEILLTNKTPLSAEIISQLPDLRYIGVLATGYNVVDVKTAIKQGVTVTNVPTYGTNSVAQMVFALLLELCHHVQAHSGAVREGEWARSLDFCFWNYPLIELIYERTRLLWIILAGQRFLNCLVRLMWSACIVPCCLKPKD